MDVYINHDLLCRLDIKSVLLLDCRLLSDICTAITTNTIDISGKQLVIYTN